MTSYHPKARFEQSVITFHDIHQQIGEISALCCSTHLISRRIRSYLREWFKVQKIEQIPTRHYPAVMRYLKSLFQVVLTSRQQALTHHQKFSALYVRNLPIA